MQSPSEPIVSQPDRETKPLRRRDILKILLRHKGSITRIAESLGINQTTVSQWLHGRTQSQRIADAANAMALQLLEQEKQVTQDAGKLAS